MKIGEKNMEENTQEKDLIEKKESFFSKVKNFFTRLFKKKEKNTADDEINIVKESNDFKENIKVEEAEQTDEMKILELQKRYRRGEIAEGDLTEEQIEALSDLYDRQIEALKKVIAEKEQKIAEHKKQKVEENNT